MCMVRECTLAGAVVQNTPLKTSGRVEHLNNDSPAGEETFLGWYSAASFSISVWS